ncbi:MAG: hypothetical protein NTY19_39430, partial [Planctomycetota bacterium]|nr:hypothetical protein [Planctomycetota bacterium]
KTLHLNTLPDKRGFAFLQTGTVPARGSSPLVTNVSCAKNKKTDVAERPKAFDHVGLLVNDPPGTAELLSI